MGTFHHILLAIHVSFQQANELTFSIMFSEDPGLLVRPETNTEGYDRVCAYVEIVSEKLDHALGHVGLVCCELICKI